MKLPFNTATKSIQRKKLAAEGLKELEKRGRTSHIILTDRAWAWAFDAFGEEVSGFMEGQTPWQPLRLSGNRFD